VASFNSTSPEPALIYAANPELNQFQAAGRKRDRGTNPSTTAETVGRRWKFHSHHETTIDANLHYMFGEINTFSRKGTIDIPAISQLGDVGSRINTVETFVQAHRNVHGVLGLANCWGYWVVDKASSRQ
jgi:hypothetical protein